MRTSPKRPHRDRRRLLVVSSLLPGAGLLGQLRPGTTAAFGTTSGALRGLSGALPCLLLVGGLTVWQSPGLNRMLPLRPRALRSRAGSRLPPERLCVGLVRTPDRIAPDNAPSLHSVG